MSRRDKKKKQRTPAMDATTQQTYKQLVAVLERAPVTPYGATDLSEAGRHPQREPCTRQDAASDTRP